MVITLIDFSSLISQVPKQALKFKTSTGINSGHVFHFFKMFRAIKNAFNSDILFFCLDTGRSGRTLIDPEYKANRTGEKHILRSEVEPILKSLPVIIASGLDHEADDVVWTLAKRFYKKKQITGINILAKDYDISQVLRIPKVRHFMTLSHEVTPNSLFIKFGCDPKQLALYKAIFGDTIDNITGLKLGSLKKKVLSVFQSGASNKKIAKMIPKNKRKKLLTNLQLTKLIDVEDIDFNLGQTDYDEVQDFLSHYEIKKFTADNTIPGTKFNAQLFGDIL